MQEIQETWFRSLDWEGPLEEEIATCSSILVWKVLWTEEPGGLQSMGSQRIRYEWESTHHTPLDSTPSLWRTFWGKPWTIWYFPLIIFFYSAHWMAEWVSLPGDSTLPSISTLLLSLSAGSWSHPKAHLFTGLVGDAVKTGLLQNMMVGFQGSTFQKKSETETERNWDQGKLKHLAT